MLIDTDNESVHLVREVDPFLMQNRSVDVVALVSASRLDYIGMLDKILLEELRLPLAASLFGAVDGYELDALLPPLTLPDDNEEHHGSQENEDGDDAERDEDVGDVVVGHFANRTRARRLLGADVGAQVFGRRCHRYAVRFVGDSHGCLLLRLGPNSKKPSARLVHTEGTDIMVRIHRDGPGKEREQGRFLSWRLTNDCNT